MKLDICVGPMCCSPKQAEKDVQVMQAVFQSLAVNEFWLFVDNVYSLMIVIFDLINCVAM